MDDQTQRNAGTMVACAQRLIRRLLTIGENRLALLAVEVQEEGGRLMHALGLVLGVAVLGMLSGITLTATVVVLLWPYSPAIVLASLATLYALVAAYLARQLSRLLRDWQILAGTLEQLRKDRACLEEKPS